MRTHSDIGLMTTSLYAANLLQLASLCRLCMCFWYDVNYLFQIYLFPRYYVAAGVRIYSQENWKIITGNEGKRLVEKFIKETVI